MKGWVVFLHRILEEDVIILFDDIFSKILLCWVIQQRRKHSEDVRYPKISTLLEEDEDALGSAWMFVKEEQ